MQTNKQFIEEFEYTLHLAELKALSKYSLKQPLTDNQTKRMLDLGTRLGMR